MNYEYHSTMPTFAKKTFTVISSQVAIRILRLLSGHSYKNGKTKKSQLGLQYIQLVK